MSPIVMIAAVATACRCPVGYHVGMLARRGALVCVESPPAGCEDPHGPACPAPHVLPWVVTCWGVAVVDSDGHGVHCEEATP